VEVIRAGFSEIDAMAPLFDAYRVFYGQPSDPGKAREFLEARLSAGESALFLAREKETDGGAALGFVQLYPSFSSVSLGPIQILNDLFVAPEAQRRGVGRALLLRAHDFAREAGAIRVVLSTAKDNVRARSLYVSLGYALDSVFDHYALALPPR
jgi:ribosomal protein S18 acetylase RimI-like enzyme